MNCANISTNTSRKRLDQLVVQRGLAETRERAQALILDGLVLLDDAPATKPGQRVGDNAKLKIKPGGPTFVSRGALKLQAALDTWSIDPTGAIVLDVGASTGGFTDLLLQRNARRVYAVDVGYGQLHYKLRNDPRVVVMERTNARTLEPLPEPINLAACDVSFISLRLVLPAVMRSLDPSALIVALIKPQFEAGREHVGKGGVVRDQSIRDQVVQDIAEWSQSQPWRVTDVLESPIKGPAGNVEFLSRWSRHNQP